jgi:hypothetical protein
VRAQAERDGARVHLLAGDSSRPFGAGEEERGEGAGEEGGGWWCGRRRGLGGRGISPNGWEAAADAE